jgi:serine/threonine-protein kinase
MTNDDDLILEAIDRIADGQPVDWSVLEASASSESLRARIAELKIIAGVADLARSPDAEESRLHGDRTPITWGPLKILEKVGEGAFGEVFRAWDSRLDREVALKLLKHRAADPDALPSSVIEEGRLLARVRHPNVAMVYGADRIGERVGIWMEFVHGRPLDKVVQEDGPLAADPLAIVGRDLSRALRAVHDVGMLHRDIKANNVLRQPDGRVVLADFGTGGDLDAVSPSELAGTPLYLAPELLRGEAASAQSDIYSVGVLLFHLATGTFPVGGKTLADVKDAHARGERIPVRQLRPDLPDILIAAIERATAPDPAGRFENAAALEAAVSAAVQNAPAGAKGRTPSRAWIAGLAVVSGLSLTTLAIWMSSRPQSSNGVVTARHVKRDVEGWGPMTADGRFVGCRDPATGNIALCDLRHGDIRPISRDASANAGAGPSAISPDGRRIAYRWRVGHPREARFDLRVIRVIDGSVQNLHTGGDQGISFAEPYAWSPDGTHLAVRLQRIDQTYALALVAPETAVFNVVAESRQRAPSDVRWSPDGRFLAYSTSAGANSAPGDIFTVDLQTGRIQPLVEHPAHEYGGVWSRSGREFVFASDRAGTPGFWKISVSNGTAVSDPVLVHALGRERAIRPMGFSDDGSLYYWADLGGLDVFTAPIDVERGTVGQATRVSQDPLSYSASSAWSPDGRRLAYLEDRRSGFAGATKRENVIVIQDMESGATQSYPITTQIHQTPLRWSPDGRAIVLTNDVAAERRLWHVDLSAKRIVALPSEPRPPRPPRPEPARRVYPKPLIAVAASPSGARATTADNGDGTFVQLRFTKDGPLRELAVTRRCLMQAWSADERWLLLSCSDHQDMSDSSLYRLPAEGGSLQRLGLTLDQIFQVQVHPDGRQIAFTAGKSHGGVWALGNLPVGR